MKLIHITPFPKRLIKRKKHGFALIASLTLMMLLTLLAVGILAMASSQNRIALQTMLQAEARQQALVGLDAAIGELQMAMGPDRRVSASSSITSESEGSVTQHLLGVWNSWSGPIYGRPVDGKGSNIGSTYNQGRSSMFRQWLISSRNPAELRDYSAASRLGSRDPGRRICMVGEGTLGKRLTGRHYIYADMIAMPSSGKNTACFAWWIGGENQKAKITITDPEEDTNPIEVLHRTWNTPGPIFMDSEYLDFLPEKIEKPEKLLTMASLPLLGTSSQSAGMPYFFDVTTSSYSLPINVRTGGLKQDLCLLLNKKSLRNTDFAARSNQDCPIVEGNDVPRGTEGNMPIGSWQNLYAYYNCWPDGSANDGDNVTGRLIGSVNDCYTRISGSGTTLNQNDYGDLNGKQSSSGSAFDSRSMLDQGISSAGYARTPVMLAFMNTFGLTTLPMTGQFSSGSGSEKQQLYRMGLCFAPMFLWWNPYNVPMRIRGQQLWAHSAPYKNTWIQSYSNTSQTAWAPKWGTYAMTQGGKQVGTTDEGGAIYAGFGQDYGNYFQNSLSDTTGDIIFEPGEILFFSPGVARSTSSLEGNYNAPWVLGYNANGVAGYSAHFYGKGGDPETNPTVCTESNINKDGQFYVKLRLGINDTAGSYTTDGGYFAPDMIDCITVLNGYTGMGSTGAAGTDGKYGMSPQRFLLGWYNPDETSTGSNEGPVFCDENAGKWTTSNGAQADSSVPYFIAAVGIVAKSGSRNVDEYIFSGSDFRTKSWQHSNPAFWGSSIARPDDQMRQYHPYQLAALDVGSGFDLCPMVNEGDNGVLGITDEGEQVSFVSCLELPVHPPFSLAGFAGMRLQPGWYESGSDTISRFRRMQYQSGVPGVGIGNSFADPCLPANDVYALHEMNISTASSGNSRVFNDFFDHGLLINDALWDRWFCSSISDMPSTNGKRNAQDVAQAFVDGKEQLPVARYVKSMTPYNNESVVKALMEEDGWKKVAQFLMIDGGFNINSTSEEAWAAVLQGLSKRLLVSNSGGRLQLVEPGKNRDQVLFSRFMVSTTSKSIDSLGGYSMMQGSSSLRSNSGGSTAWGEVRSLSSDVIRELAKEMVKQVRKRGPFLNMSDFVNRRLDSGSDDALKGALQAAIDATDINREFNDETVSAVGSGNLYKFPKAEEGSIYTAAPGYLIQSDVLASLGNILTVRDDTFTVRAYGCVRNPRKAILAQAWCEAVVQRTMDYVDPTNKPEDAEYDPDGRRSSGLSAANKVFGRKFRIVSFKWLDAWDI